MFTGQISKGNTVWLNADIHQVDKKKYSYDITTLCACRWVRPIYSVYKQHTL